MGKVANREIYEIKPWLNDDKQNVTRLNAIVNGGGSDIEVEAVTFTENGTFTAPSGKAYSPVTVNVSGGSSDFSTATVTITVDTTEATTGELALYNVVHFEDGFAFITDAGTVNFGNDSYEVILYQGKGVLVDDGGIVLSAEGSVEQIEEGYLIKGDCHFTVKIHSFG